MKLKKMISAICAAALSVSALCTTTAVTASAAGFDPNNATVSQIITDMGIGWNLGNSLDSTGSLETSWGNPVTTKAMIDTIRNKGFDTVRIPVTWGSRMIDDNYTIDESWLDRVQEVVDYAYDEGMYVIINMHHDTGTANYNYFPDTANYAKSEKFVKAVWTQVATKFSSYDDHLIFETLNEPRLIGTDYEWDGGSNSTEVKDARNCINKLNQVAVNTIRANDANKDRMLMCPGYAASPEGAAASDFKIPTDVSGNKNRIAVSIHGYRPYNFAMQGSGGAKAYLSSVKAEVTKFFNYLNTNFTSKGINVVIGETGATNKDNSDARAQWATDYFTLAKQYNIACVIWDNNYFGKYVNGKLEKLEENFGLLDRKTLTFFDETYTNAIVKIYAPQSISGATCTVSSQAYTGKALTPNVTVKLGTKTLVKGTDYTVTYKNNTNVGTASYTVTGIGSYSGTKNGSFVIKKSAVLLDFAAISNQVWANKALTPALTIKDGTKTLVSGTDYTVKYSNNVNTGVAKATVTLKGTYAGTKTVTFKIVPKKQKLNTLTGVKGGVRITYAGTRVATGYQIKYSTKADMSDAKTIWVTKGTSTLKTITGLKKGTKYYFTVRTYSTVDGVKYAGAWAAKHSCVAK